MKTSNVVKLLVVLLLIPLTTQLCAQPRQVPDPMVREGAMVKLGEYTYAIPDNNVGGVPNVGIVVGERATLVIDPGLGRENGEIVLREVAKVSDNDELYIASTHFHPEHTVGYVAFPESAKYINSITQEEEFAENGMRFVGLFANRNERWGKLLQNAERRVADITYENNYELDLGGVVVKMMVVGPTHTRGDTGFFVEQDKVLFAGDVVMNESFLSANQGSSVKAWLMAFDTFEALQPKSIVPAHGAIGGGELIPEQRKLVTRIRDMALGLKEERLSDDQIADMVSQQLRADHPDWPRANGIAALARSALNEN